MEQEREVVSADATDGRVTLELAAVSDRGTVRRENQDAFAIFGLGGGDAGAVVILADGMGGHAGGREAATLAVSAAGEHLATSEDPRAALRVAVERANAAVAALRRSNDGEMMGTTFVAAVIAAGRATFANVGDSRGYVVRRGLARQITQDHSALAEAMREGRAPDALGALSRNLLTRALTGEDVHADTFSLAVATGDVVVLCSDGAWDWLDDARLATLVHGRDPLTSLFERTCDAALAAGSNDNVSLAGCRIRGPLGAWGAGSRKRA